MGELRTVLRFLQTIVGIGWWCISTTWLGLVALWRGAVLASRLSAFTAEVRFCPRGHEVAAYGRWDCACGSRVEGWAFALCPVCRESAGYVPCPICGLPVRNPFLP